MSLGENSLVAAYQGKGQLKSRPSETGVVTFIGGSGGIRDPTRKRLTGYTTGYDIQRVRDLFRDSVDYERQWTNISLCSKRLVWRCGAEIKRLWRTQKRLYPS